MSDTIYPNTKVKKMVEDTLKRQKRFKWVEEGSTLDPEVTEDRDKRGQRKKIRVAMNFAFWRKKGRTLEPAYVKPSATQDWSNIVMRSEIASVHGPSRYLMQAGLFDVDWPLRDTPAMEVGNILSIGIDSDRMFQNGKKAMCVRTARYYYFLLEPEDCYEHWWTTSVRAWEEKRKVKTGSLTFVRLKPDDPRPDWFWGRYSWAKFAVVDVSAIPARETDVNDRLQKTEVPRSDLVPDAEVVKGNAPRQTRVGGGKGKGRAAVGQEGKGGNRSSTAPAIRSALGKRNRAGSPSSLESPESIPRAAGIRKPRLGSTPNHTPGPLEVTMDGLEFSNTEKEARDQSTLTSINEGGPSSGPAAASAPPASPKTTTATPSGPPQESENLIPTCSEPLSAPPETQLELNAMGFGQSHSSTSGMSHMQVLPMLPSDIGIVTGDALNASVGDDGAAWTDTFDSTAGTHEMSQPFTDYGPHPPFTQDTYDDQSHAQVLLGFLGMLGDSVLEVQDGDYWGQTPSDGLRPPNPLEEPPVGNEPEEDMRLA